MFRAADVLLLMPLSVFLPPLWGWSASLHTAGEDPPLADGFDFPVGAPHAHGYYDAQSFGENYHLGEDWNGNGGGSTDLGDPVHSVATGVVSFAGDLGGGWGNVVRVVHAYDDAGRVRKVESFYAHLDRVHVREGQLLARGEVLGTIGDADGAYIAHLHFEMRDRVGLPHGPGYSDRVTGWLSPSEFIRRHRPTARAQDLHAVSTRPPR
ncbi:MAG: M23 family metallopeptidase [Alphaproteobacteria bacterium]|nr:M23 family metallopeptidase [Alphaproteobacteria bacterium]